MTDWDLLRKVADRIERENRFDMGTYGRKDGLCGTVACVAGHIVWMTEPGEFEKAIFRGFYSRDIHSTATDKLNISDNEADELFAPTGGVDINNHKNLVPAALRWMSDNECLSWDKAGPAVGFFKEMADEFADSEAGRLYAECEEISQFDMA
jgi:hypothetical protein